MEMVCYVPDFSTETFNERNFLLQFFPKDLGEGSKVDLVHSIKLTGQNISDLETKQLGIF